LPWFREAEFLARFPFATVRLQDPAVPFDVEIVGFSPFTPPEADPSSLPVGALEYRFTNRSQETRRAVFSLNTRNFMGNGSIGPIEGGFVLYATAGEDRDQNGAFAFLVDGDKAVVDHCWFRGGWWDALTIAWNNVEKGILLKNPPQPDNAPGASLSVPMTLKPGEEKTVRLLTCWYVPQTNLRYGNRSAGPAFRGTPSHGTAGNNQQTVSGFLGKGLINTYDPDGDGPTGTLTSPEFKVDRRYLHCLVGGGDTAGQTCVNLIVEGVVFRSAVGRATEELAWATFDLAEVNGRRAEIQIVDRATGAWGHILADHFVLSDEPIDRLRTGPGNALTTDTRRVTVLQDFEGPNYGKWVADPPLQASCCPDGECAGGVCEPEIPPTYVPWYATQFRSIAEVAQHWKTNYVELQRRSTLFRDTFYDTTLPPEVVEAVAANLTILKSPTVLRQHDGRLWCWEGCSDSSGCCAGSCTHVWNYAQAICHLFPSLARGMRQTEYFESQNETGRQAFRGNLPIAPGGGSFDASDGQLGGIMKAYREWRISGNDAWLRTFWPQVRQSLDYMIEKYDPRHTGLLEEDHHNTYDINYFGPDGHCGSFYLGALAAAVKMGRSLDSDVTLYEKLLEKGKRRMQAELFNGEYFIQIVQKEGLDHNFGPINPADQSAAYRQVAEIVNQQGPKYQYGNGCLADGVLGLWMAAVCGIDDEIIPRDKVRSHLLSI
ncbi:MAG TPA: GH116 family glycosyl hydrolase, partial [Thermoguttaceae bacterium]|nr:GH116 family glycosyl hydrolase [Thermoguttaceae bacterium]